MDTDTYHNAEIAKYLNENFVNILIDTDKDGATAKTFKVRAIPDTRFIDPAGNELLRIVGHRPDFFDQVKSLGEISAVEKSLKEKPDDIPTMIAASDVYQKLARIKEAIELLEKAAEKDTDNKSGRLEEVFYKLGLAQLKGGHGDRAEAAWAQVGRLDPENKKGWFDDIQFDRCRRQCDEQDWLGAERSLDEFLKRFPDSDHAAEARYQLGMALFFNEKREDAISVWKDLIREQPGSEAAKKAEKGLKYAEKKKKK